jgi:gluconolactonase
MTSHTNQSTQTLQGIEVYDDRMRSLLKPKATLQKLAGGAVHTEGPVYIPADGSVIYSDAHGNKLLCWHPDQGVTVLREPSDYQNGNAMDRSGRLVACSSGLRAIIRQMEPGDVSWTWPVLVDHYRGKRLNSPNDLTVKGDGSLWFTDPPYGINQPDQGYGGEQEQPGSYVYRYDPETDEIDAVITDMLRPNGIVFSPDESILYVSDSSSFNIPDGFHYVRAYEVRNGRQVVNGRVFAEIEPGQPDGLCVDRQGNLFVTSQDSIQVFAPDGTRLGKIYVPETCANLTFGGADGSRLFITAGHSLYAIELSTQGKPNA